jgi:hypothetical protein
MLLNMNPKVIPSQPHGNGKRFVTEIINNPWVDGQIKHTLRLIKLSQSSSGSAVLYSTYISRRGFSYIRV